MQWTFVSSTTSEFWPAKTYSEGVYFRLIRASTIRQPLHAPQSHLLGENSNESFEYLLENNTGMIKQVLVSDCYPSIFTPGFKRLRALIDLPTYPHLNVLRQILAFTAVTVEPFF